MVAHISSSARYPMTVECKHCKQVFTLYIDTQDLETWLIGNGFIQDIMPYLTNAERELLISNSCGVCFDKIFNIE